MSSACVDVAMPAHMPPSHIAEAVDSALGQSHSDVRVMILDDGNQGDAIHDVLGKRLSDPRVDYRRTEHQVSAVEAHTRLMAASDAPFFAFLHDDDRWEPEMLARRLGYLGTHPEVGMVFGGHRDIDSAGTAIAEVEYSHPEGTIDRCELLQAFYVRNAVPLMHSVVLRGDVLAEVGPYLDPRFSRVYDWEFWFRVAMEAEVAYLQSRDVCYRLHAEQMSHAPYTGDQFADLIETIDARVRQRHPECAPAPAVVGAVAAAHRVSIALDCAQEGQRRRALRALRAAFARSRRSAVSPRFAAALGLVILPGSVRARFREWRAARHRRDLTVYT